MFMNVANVNMGDSSSSSKTVGASLGFDLHILQYALSFLTWLLFKTTVLISIFMASTPPGGEMRLGAICEGVACGD